MTRQTPQRKVIVITTGFGMVVDAALAKGGLRKFFAEVGSTNSVAGTVGAEPAELSRGRSCTGLPLKVIGREHPLSEAKQGRKVRARCFWFRSFGAGLGRPDPEYMTLPSDTDDPDQDRIIEELRRKDGLSAWQAFAHHGIWQ